VIEKYKSILTQLTGIVLFMSLFNYQAQAQQIDGPQSIISSFQNDLAYAVEQNNDTILVYHKYVRKLINRGNFISADSILSKINTRIQLLKNTPLKTAIIKDRAYMYKVQKRYEKALQDYLWLKEYHEASNNIVELAEVNCLLAEYYRALRQFSLFGKHLELAKDLFKDSEPSNELLAYWYSRKVAWCTEVTGNTDSLLYYADKGLGLLSQSNEVLTKSLILNELGFNALNRKLEGDITLGYFNEAKDLLFEQERYRDYVEIVNNIVIYHFRAGNNELAIKNAQDILQIQENNKWFGPLQTTYDYLANLYSRLGQRQKSLEFHEKSLLSAINNINAIHEIELNDLAIGYEKDLTEKELQLQAQRTLTAEEEAVSNKRAYIIALIAASVLLLFSLATFLINVRFRKKNDLLNAQRLQIQKANSELESSLNHQTTLYKELNHRVKNNLSVLTGLIYLQEVGENSDDFKNTLVTLRGRVKSMALAHESLYNSEGVNKFSFQEYLKELFNELSNALSDPSKIQVQIDCEGFELGFEQSVPLAMVLNEFFTNSLKHGFKDSKSGIITVKGYHSENESVLIYADNGRGIIDQPKDKKTLGLKLISLLLEQLDATIEQKNEGSGVWFVIRIPDPTQNV